MENFGVLAGYSGLFAAVLAFFKFFLNRQIRDLDKRLVACETKWDLQRTRSHRVIQELVKGDLLLQYVNDQHQACTCGSLDVIAPALERYIADLPDRNEMLKAVPEP